MKQRKTASKTRIGIMFFARFFLFFWRLFNPGRHLKIIVAPNPDGFGPSTILAAAVKALIDILQKAGIPVSVIVYAAQDKFNKDLYQKEINAGIVEIRKCPHGIKLAKDKKGCVDAVKNRDLLPSYFANIDECMANCPWDDDADLVISLGSPHYLFKAKTKAKWHKVPLTIELADHLWSWTLSEILAKKELLDPAANDLLARLRTLEKYGDECVTFPSVITPQECVAEMRHVFPHMNILTGIFGKNGHSRKKARERLGVFDEDAVVLIVGGGTEVWDGLIRALYDSFHVNSQNCHANPQNYHIVLPNPVDKANWYIRHSDGTESDCQRSTPMGELLPGIELVATRCGAGIVFDTLVAVSEPAYGPVLLAVPEDGHIQVEAIRKALRHNNLSVDIDLPSFLNDQVGIDAKCSELLAAIEQALGTPPGELATIRCNMMAIPKGEEDAVAAKIIANTMMQPMLLRFANVLNTLIS